MNEEKKTTPQNKGSLPKISAEDIVVGNLNPLRLNYSFGQGRSK
ncbi:MULTISPECIES: hypothetical protein [Enterococcus]|nr:MULTISPECIES: hypothetical protein [Enterococcus]MDT2510002.1 hypothetical protein [Enterococcus avium]MDT2662712.1 hypothetical protein [Enterococcus hulanensis]BBM19796.1 hypothetical protein G15_3477 [Enterococcus avium]